MSQMHPSNVHEFVMVRSPTKHIWYNIVALNVKGKVLYAYAIDLNLDEAQELTESLNKELSSTA